MIDDVLYVSTPYNRVVALDATTGRELWRYDPEPYKDGQPPNGTGFVHRGVAAWRDDAGQLRIFMNSRYRLICLDAKTGTPVTTFGEQRHRRSDRRAVVDDQSDALHEHVAARRLQEPRHPRQRRRRSARVPQRSARRRPRLRRAHRQIGVDVPPDSAARRVRQRHLGRRFVGVHRPHQRVGADVARRARAGCSICRSARPATTTTAGDRPGANLFAESIVCLDAAHRQRKWHFQIVHHGLWDYDLPAAPILRRSPSTADAIDAVVQLTKQGFAFVFDRVTGEPVWPIEERPVPPSDVPASRRGRRSRFRRKPPPFVGQGVTLDDAFDLTPELRDAGARRSWRSTSSARSTRRRRCRAR